jgi:hypothetical protein
LLLTWVDIQPAAASRSSFLQDLARVEGDKLRDKRRTQISGTAQAYLTACAAAGVTSFPVSYESIAGYLVQFVGKQKGSAASLANVKSHLRIHCRASGLSWLSEQDACRLRDVEKNLRFYDTAVGRRKRPLLRAIIIKICGRLLLDASLDLLMAVTMFVGHDGLLRGGELWKGLRVRDIEWSMDRSSFQLWLDRTKTHRSGAPIAVSYVEVRGEIGAVPLLRMWFDRRGLWDKPDAFLWCEVVRARGVFSLGTGTGGTSKANWVEVMRMHLDAIGLDSSQYAGHSCRAGGATDLFTSKAAVPYIMKFGRWETVEACMEYFRGDLEIATEVARLFAGCV